MLRKNGLICVIKLNSELCYEMLVEACILVTRIKAGGKKKSLLRL